MPFTAKSARKHTKKATSKKAKRQWAKVAEKVRRSTGDEGRAIRIANAVVKKRRRKKS